jgi:hypothetical protein
VLDYRLTMLRIVERNVAGAFIAATLMQRVACVKYMLHRVPNRWFTHVVLPLGKKFNEQPVR